MVNEKSANVHSNLLRAIYQVTMVGNHFPTTDVVTDELNNVNVT